MGTKVTDQVRDDLVALAGARGQVYADQKSMHQAVPAEMNYPDDELYLAQVALWVQQDIIAAIVKTNQQFQRRGDTRKLEGVAASAIKRLVYLDVRGYVVMAKSEVVGSPAHGAPPDQYPSMVPVQPTRAQQVGKAGYIGSAPGAASVPQLTGRVTNPLYDVVHYELTVVMVDRQLMQLYRNLLASNFHTILDVEIGKVGRPVLPLGMPQPVVSGSEGLYDYGPDPVVQVRITGELQLLAEFTRGRWDAEANDWDKTCPPLMPKEFLRKLDAQDSSALREEDKRRLTAWPGAAGEGGVR